MTTSRPYRVELDARLTAAVTVSARSPELAEEEAKWTWAHILDLANREGFSLGARQTCARAALKPQTLTTGD